MTSDSRDARKDGRPSIVGKAVRIYLAILAITAAVLLALRLQLILILIFLAAIIAAGMERPASLLERLRLPRVAAVIISYLVLLAILAGFLFLLVPPMVTQAQEFADEVPSLIDRLRSLLPGFLTQFIPPGTGSIKEIVSGIPLPSLGGVVGAGAMVLGILANTAIVLVLSAMLLMERDAMWQWSLNFVPAEHREEIRQLVVDALKKLGAYLRGQIIVMTVTGTWATIGMLIFGVPFALPLGFFAFLTEAIPLLGPFVSGGLILLVAITAVDPLTTLWMFLWFLFIEQLEGWVLIPIIHGNVLRMSPAVAFVAVVVGGTLAGVVGAVIALPVTAVIDVTLREIVMPLRDSAAERRDAAGEPATESSGGDAGEAKGA